jgi:hypothetical protein
MKLFIPALIVALVAAGCSPKGDTSASESPAVVAADLGKTEEYFKGLYGAPKTEKRVGDYAFSLPGHGSMIGLTRPLTVQQYESGKLKATVVYSETPRRAIWVKYTLPSPWTQEQIKAALGAYCPEWKVVQENLGMDFVMHERAPVVYSSRAGSLAYKTMFNELIVYAPQLYADLLGQIEEGERQKRAVPKF